MLINIRVVYFQNENVLSIFFKENDLLAMKKIFTTSLFSLVLTYLSQAQERYIIKLDSVYVKNNHKSKIEKELKQKHNATAAYPLTNYEYYEKKSGKKFVSKANLLWNIEFENSKSKNARGLSNSSKINHFFKLKAHTLSIPNDPKADSVLSATGKGQTFLQIHSFYKAWDITKGDTNISIGIVDGGFNLNHEDLVGKVKHNNADPINGINDDGDSTYYLGKKYALLDNFQGWDLVHWDNDPNQPLGKGKHGTMVAGVLAANTNNNLGVAGAAYNMKYIPYKVAPDNNGSALQNPYEGLIMAAEQGCSIINCSWGDPDTSYTNQNIEILQSIIDYCAIDLDAVVVCAAGLWNQGKSVTWLPAGLDHVLSVDAVNANKVLVNQMTYNYSVDLSAAGAGMYTTGGGTNASYSTDLGTSLAAPVVAGAAGLVRSYYPFLNSQQVIEQLRVTGDVIDTLPGNANYKYGLGYLLNPYRALTELTHPSLRVYNPSLDKDLTIPGDTIYLTFAIANYLVSTSENTNLKIKVVSGNVVDTNTYSLTIPPLSNNSATGTVTLAIAFNKNMLNKEYLAVRFLFSNSSYNAYDFAEFYITKDLMTASSELFDEQDINIKNPVDDHLVIFMNDNQVKNPIASVFSSTGKLVLENHLYSITNKKLGLDIKKLPAGVYILNFETTKAVFQKKFIKN